MASRWAAGADPALPAASPGSPQPSPGAPPPRPRPRPRPEPPPRRRRTGGGGPGPGAARADLDLGPAGRTGGFHPAGAGPGHEPRPRPRPRPRPALAPGAGRAPSQRRAPQAAMTAGAAARPAPRWLKALAEPLSAAQLRRLEEHRYSATGASLLEPPLQLYWTWLLQWVPLWMAPNSITLLGLAINLLTTLVLISYCPTATEEVGPAARPRPAAGPPTAVPRSPASPARAPPRVRRGLATGGARGPGRPPRG